MVWSLWNEIEEQAVIWDVDVASAVGIDYVKDLMETAEKDASASAQAAYEAKLVTGKQRLEYRWQSLDADWQKAFKDPILKAVKGLL